MILYPSHSSVRHLVAHVGVGSAGESVKVADFEYYPDGHADLLIQLTDAGCELVLFGLGGWAIVNNPSTTMWYYPSNISNIYCSLSFFSYAFGYA